MKAMILAAGLGTRLKPLTDTRPKALVEINGVPILELTISYLKKEGIDNITINVHHFSNQIIEFLANKDFGVNFMLSDESESLLDTGGGIVKAYQLNFGNDKAPLLVHNVDIISNADIQKLHKAHFEGEADVTLLISERTSTRKLIFDEKNILKGWHRLSDNKFIPEHIRDNDGFKEFAFSGIYIINNSAVEEMKKLHGTGKYSIMDYFLNPERKKIIKGYVQENLELIDIGKPAGLSQASEYILRNNHSY